MIKQLITTEIYPQEGDNIIRTPEITGRIEKIIVNYNDVEAEEAELSISTEHGEVLVNIEGTTDGIWYPRNWNVQSQKYTGVNMLSEGQSAMDAERWVVTGRLLISFKSSQQSDYIRQLIIVYTDESPPVEIIDNIEEEDDDIIKDDAPVTTDTAGVSNPTHGRQARVQMNMDSYASSKRKKKRRGYYIGKYYNMVKGEFTKDLKKNVAIAITKTEEDDLKQFVEEAVFSKTFEGMTKTTSTQIKDYLIRAAVKGYNNDRILNYIQRKGGTGTNLQSANVIFRTENHELSNKMREWTFNKTNIEGEDKYKWISIQDDRRTKICENITKRTAHGVTIAKLKEIIKDETEKAKSRGELPSNYDAREFTPHWMCRSSFVRRV